MKKILVIGASSGGPPVLFKLLPKFTSSFKHPVVVSQHMPEGFTGPMAELLDEHTELFVKEAEDQEKLEPSKVLICPAPYHLFLVSKGDHVNVSLRTDPVDSVCTPRIDCTMESAAKIFGEGTLAVVLSGMSAGEDCIKGAKAIRAVGGRVFTQEQSTCMCSGMPQGVVNAGLSDLEVSTELLYARIIDFMDGN